MKMVKKRRVYHEFRQSGLGRGVEIAKNVLFLVLKRVVENMFGTCPTAPKGNVFVMWMDSLSLWEIPRRSEFSARNVFPIPLFLRGSKRLNLLTPAQSSWIFLALRSGFRSQ